MKTKLSRLAAKMNKGILSTLAAVTLALGTVHITATAKAELTTVYHVYIEDQFIGTVQDKASVEALIEGKTNSLQEQYKEVDLEVGGDLSYIPEQVFSTVSTTASDKVLEGLEGQLSVQANVSALVINGEAVAYVKDEDSAAKVINNLKLGHVSEEQLTQLENSNGEETTPLKENETRILDVRLTEDVSIAEEKIDPQEILSVEAAMELIKKGTLEEKKYEVQPGDVLGGIANSHGLTLKELLTINPQYSEESVLKPGDELAVTYHEPLAKVIVEKEVYQTEKISYEKEVIEDDSLLKGETKVKQSGKDGVNGITYKITEQNGIVITKEAAETKVIEEPVKEVIIKGTKVIPSRGTGSFVWPTNGGYISSKMGYRWGQMHKGIDIARPNNHTIKAADNGKVVSASYDGGYGNKVVIDHQNGYRTVYAHLASISVSPGQTVERGAKIGVMGSTGHSTGVHLHFEVYKNGSLVDPLSLY
ncbi:M23 family metallopeptidase [Bacillus sp. B15-48]|uniref:M23 family metallopeptidase n=1 Tax=Bacillus sp. B15-48 TaxID=1548601 RepID=UPI00193F9137|nr:M23 family metallopeptidase [Bacillus sp. B15-48]MBM4761706.1 peptidoglycan DD-metalloendopeptidase family protein [Bacillus sp. B15-48]